MTLKNSEPSQANQLAETRTHEVMGKDFVLLYHNIFT